MALADAILKLYNEGKSFKAIGKAVGLPSGSVEYAIRKLRKTK